MQFYIAPFYNYRETERKIVYVGNWFNPSKTSIILAKLHIV